MCILSSPLPLRITVHDMSVYKCPEPYELVSLVMNILVRNPGELEDLFQRCRSLSWFICKGIARINLNLVTCTPTSASLPALELPALEYLTISDLRITDELHGARFPRLPRLKEVNLINHSGRWTPFFHDDDFARGEKLTLEVSKWSNDDLICIGRFRSIRTLVLRGMWYNNGPRWEWSSIGVELPLLEALVLHGRVEEKILALIEAPGLKRMQFEQNTYGRDSLFAKNLRLLVQPVEYLHLWLSPHIHATSRVEELGELIDGAPSLIGVFVSRWMEQRLREYKWTDATRNLRFSLILDCSKQLLEM